MKKITRRHRESIQWAGLNPDNWLIKKATEDEIILYHKFVGRARKIPS
jgi:hypothetical protein